MRIPAAIVVAMLVVACAGPVPSATHTPAPVVAPTGGPPTAIATDAPSASPVLAAFGAPYPDDGWSVAASVDGTGSPIRVRSNGRAAAGALIDLAFACDQPVTIAIGVTDTSAPGVPHGSVKMVCEPGRVHRSMVPSIDDEMVLGLDVTVDSPARFWVKLGVPTDHFVALQ